MVQATDLRIGNLVRLSSTTSETEFEIVDGIGNNKASEPLRCIHLAGNGIWNFEAQVKPIPLTPELLEKCGFEKIDEEDDTVFMHEKMGVSLWYGTGNPDGSETGYYLSESVYKPSPLSRNQQYLHQLQNLYFALTQTELTITL